MTPGVVPAGAEFNVRKGQAPSSSSTPAKDSSPVSGPAARVVISAAAREAHGSHEASKPDRAPVTIGNGAVAWRSASAGSNVAIANGAVAHGVAAYRAAEAGQEISKGSASFDDTGSLTRAGEASFDDTGSLTRAGEASFDDTGSLTRAGEASFDDTGSLTRAGEASFDDTGSLTRAGAASFDDTGSLTDKVVVIGRDDFR